MNQMELIDTHCHYDSPDLADIIDAALEKARAAGLVDALICACRVEDFESVRIFAHAHGLHYMLGLHPFYLSDTALLDASLDKLRQQVKDSLTDTAFAGIGEIGLDNHPASPVSDKDLAKSLFEAQLALAKELNLPVSIHARKAVSQVIAEVRQHRVCGAVHAFAGSEEEARQLVNLGMKLGFGGALTFSGSARIRHVFAALPEDAFVLETDAPFIPSAIRSALPDRRTQPCDIVCVLEAAAELRDTRVERIAEASVANAHTVFARIAPAG